MTITPTSVSRGTGSDLRLRNDGRATTSDPRRTSAGKGLYPPPSCRFIAMIYCDRLLRFQGSKLRSKRRPMSEQRFGRMFCSEAKCDARPSSSAMLVGFGGGVVGRLGRGDRRCGQPITRRHDRTDPCQTSGAELGPPTHVQSHGTSLHNNNKTVHTARVLGGAYPISKRKVP